MRSVVIRRQSPNARAAPIIWLSPHRQIIRALAVLLSLMLLTLAAMAAAGELSIDVPIHERFGVYDSALAGLPAYYNPLLELMLSLPLLPLAGLPIVLILLRRSLRVESLPWAIAAVAGWGGLWLGALSYRSSDDIDWLASSAWPVVVPRLIYLMLCIVLSLGGYFGAKRYLKRHSKSHPHSARRS